MRPSEHVPPTRGLSTISNISGTVTTETVKDSRPSRNPNLERDALSQNELEAEIRWSLAKVRAKSEDQEGRKVVKIENFHPSRHPNLEIDAFSQIELEDEVRRSLLAKDREGVKAVRIKDCDPSFVRRP